jgi:rhodanese-related sulfurtransferase
MKSVDREQLLEMMERGDDFVLIDALSPISFAALRLPGAVNIPPGTVAERAPRRIPDPATEVIVYCQNPACDASVEVAERLIELGYLNVGHYAGGRDDWAAAGLLLEGGRARAPSTGETTTP